MRVILFFVFLPFDTIFLYHMVNQLSPLSIWLDIDFWGRDFSPQTVAQIAVFFLVASLLSAIGAWAFWQKKELD